MTDAPIPLEIHDSPAGRSLLYVLHRLRAREPVSDDATIGDYFLTDETPIEEFMESLGRTRVALGEFELRSVRSPDPNMVIAVLAHGGHISSLGIRVEKELPHRIRNLTCSEARPGYDVRRAREADGPVLSEIELKAPIVLGDVRIVYDRGDDYFAAERLMGDAVTHVLEREGQAVGLLSSIVNKIVVDGRELMGLYVHRLRVIPSARGGVANMLGFASFETHAWKADLSYAFVAVENETALRSARVGAWSVRPERIIVDTVVAAGMPCGRPATPSDAARIVSLLNSTHQREELYVSYTEETLTTRLERQPDLYSWRHLRLGARAVVGVWPARMNVIRETSGVVARDNRALVLDYGYEQGGEDELMSLIRAESSDLSRTGMGELSIFACSSSAIHSGLATFAKRTEPYRLQILSAEPADLAIRGVYVDQLYF